MRPLQIKLSLISIILVSAIGVIFDQQVYAGNANLFVSAENSQFDNHMSGPQVIEVVVIDPDIDATDIAQPEPTVTINGDILRMVQDVDGNWYGYFADFAQAQIADSTSSVVGEGLDFGTFCGPGSSILSGDLIVTVSDTEGIAIPGVGDGDEIDGTNPPTDPIPNCNASVTNVPGQMNVVREFKTVNTNSPGGTNEGQIGIDINGWPFIQLYKFSVSGNVVVQYNNPGAIQTTTLVFDNVDSFASLEIDRASYPRGAEVHVTITDPWLNIDPTDEDSWTFSTDDGDPHYNVFDENGGAPGDTATNTDSDVGDNIGDMMCGNNCVLLLDTDSQSLGTPVVTLQDNSDSQIVTEGGGDSEDPLDQETAGGNFGGPSHNNPLTITEFSQNSGTFGSFDESKISALRTTNGAVRGSTAVIDYNDDATLILVANFNGSMDVTPVDAEWNSGEEILVTLVDGDANKNSLVDEDLDLFNLNVDRIPTLVTGDPFTLAVNDDIDGAILAASWGVTGTPNDHTTFGQTEPASVAVDAISKRGIITSQAATVDTIIIDLEATAGDLKSSIGLSTAFHGSNLYNQDLRSFTGGLVDISILHNPVDPLLDVVGSSGASTTSILIADDVSAKSLTILGEVLEDTLFAIPTSDNLALMIEFSTTNVGPKEALVTDFFSFGFIHSGVESFTRENNQIIRLELEETGDSTATFEGTLEYTMINQLNVLDPSTYTGLKSIDNFATFIVLEDMTDEDLPLVDYQDTNAAGISIKISDGEDAPTHTVNLVGDRIIQTSEFTINDMDLNVDSDVFDIYTVVDGSLFSDPARDTIGTAGLPKLSFGPLGQMFEVTIDGARWQKSATCTPTGGADEGLGASGFTLVETESDSGEFTGSFETPTNFCRDGETVPESTAGLDIGFNYVDFRDASGEIIKVSKIIGIPTCDVPGFEDWTITTTCVLSVSTQFNGGILVQNGAVLIIPDGITLTITAGNNIIVVSGGGILIREGGTLLVLV